MRNLGSRVSELVSLIRRDEDQYGQPPSEGSIPKTAWVVDTDLLDSIQRPYLLKVANQINGTYEHGWYDACAVMLRRFIETLIIDTYMAKGIEDKIKRTDGDFFALRKLIDLACSGEDMTLSRDTKTILRRLKKLGDRSAHNRTFVAKRQYVESLFDDLYLDMQTLILEFVNELNAGR